MADSTIGTRIDPIRYVFSGDALADAQRIGAASRAAAARASESAEGAKDAESSTKLTLSTELAPREQQAVDTLRKIDQRVRQHEQMHVAVGGDLILSGPNFAYETGPDGKRYAVSGEVTIDTSPARTPEETVPKARHIRATALAPPDPSPQDRGAAATASRMEAEANLEIALKAQEARSAERKEANLYRQVAQYGAAAEASAASVNAFA